MAQPYARYRQLVKANLYRSRFKNFIIAWLYSGLKLIHYIFRRPFLPYDDYEKENRYPGYAGAV